jgi:hypothetical protein
VFALKESVQFFRRNVLPFDNTLSLFTDAVDAAML